MLALFYIFVAVAFALGIWQINQLLSYRKVIIKDSNDKEVEAIVKSEENPIATEKNNDMQGKFFFAFMVGFYLLMGYCLIFS